MRLNWLLEEIEVQECRRFTELRFSQHASALNYLAGKQTFEHHWKQLHEIQKQWAALSFPWVKLTQQSSDELTKKWRRAMERHYGDKLDEKTKALSEELKSVRAPAKPTPGSAWAR